MIKFDIIHNFQKAILYLLQFFVIAVVVLTASVVFIAYWLGLPYWWHRNSLVCVFLVIFGNWLLLNVSFHYYMAVTTHPGYPPQVSDGKTYCYWYKCMKLLRESLLLKLWVFVRSAFRQNLRGRIIVQCAIGVYSRWIIIVVSFRKNLLLHCIC